MMWGRGEGVGGGGEDIQMRLAGKSGLCWEGTRGSLWIIQMMQ